MSDAEREAFAMANLEKAIANARTRLLFDAMAKARDASVQAAVLYIHHGRHRPLFVMACAVFNAAAPLARS